MNRTFELDQQTILHLGVLIGAATKGSTDQLVRAAAENIFERVWEKESVTIEDFGKPGAVGRDPLTEGWTSCERNKGL